MSGKLPELNPYLTGESLVDFVHSGRRISWGVVLKKDTPDTFYPFASRVCRDNWVEEDFTVRYDGKSSPVFHARVMAIRRAAEKGVQFLPDYLG